MRYKNIEECECDRCGEKEFLQTDSPAQVNWHDCTRMTGDGKSQSFLLCSKCFEKYKDRMLTADKNFNIWLKGGAE